MRVAKDLDSAGVYFLSVEEFEWRPRQGGSDEPTAKSKQAIEVGSRINTTDDEQVAPVCTDLN
jgi:hypothetical protein